MFTKPTPAELEIRSRISARGRITFAEFMEVALYHPGGYYSTPGRITPHGDFYTSPTAHPAFGALIALALRSMWESLGSPAAFVAIELGAGNGALADGVATYAAEVGDDFARALRYVAVDQQAPPASPFHHTVRAAGAPFRKLVGCVLSNELLDAFPVHRFEIVDGKVREVYVTVRDGSLVEEVAAPSTLLIAERLAALGRTLPDGFRGEVNLRIAPWVRDVADALAGGYVMTIDYGHKEMELYSPQRSRGTLETYYRHTTGASPYQWVGAQDITAQVDFSQLIRAGEASGLKPLSLISQAEFLRRLGIERWLDKVTNSGLGEAEKEANLLGISELIRPDGLGKFKVLLQGKGSAAGDIGALLLPDAAQGVAALPVPLLPSGRVAQTRATMPQASFELTELWPEDNVKGRDR